MDINVGEACKHKLFRDFVDQRQSYSTFQFDKHLRKEGEKPTTNKPALKKPVISNTHFCKETIFLGSTQMILELFNN